MERLVYRAIAISIAVILMGGCDAGQSSGGVRPASAPTSASESSEGRGKPGLKGAHDEMPDGERRSLGALDGEDGSARHDGSELHREAGTSDRAVAQVEGHQARGFVPGVGIVAGISHGCAMPGQVLQVKIRATPAVPIAVTAMFSDGTIHHVGGVTRTDNEGRAGWMLTIPHSVPHGDAIVRAVAGDDDDPQRGHAEFEVASTCPE